MIVEHRCAVTWKIVHIVAETFFSKNSSSALLMNSKHEFDVEKTSERKEDICNFKYIMCFFSSVNLFN